MAIPGNSLVQFFAYYPGNPTSVSTAIFNEPAGTVVVDYTNNVLYQKTSALGDNSGFSLLATASSATLTAPVIAGGLTASGSAPNDFSTSTGTFKTSSGLTTISGAEAASTQALSGAGAVNITTVLTKFTSTGGAQALTLADGVDGQRKEIIHVVDGGSGVLTPTTKTGFTTITFTNAGDSASLRFVTTQGWMIVALNGAVAA